MKKKQLFLLHFAGGNSYSFKFIEPFLSEFEVICPELPGRGKRMREPLLTRFEDAANDIFLQVSKHLSGSPFIIYGHSMGAYIGLRIAAMLEQSGKHPAYLIVSGNAGPGTGDNRQRHKMPREEFVEELRRLGGAPAEFLESEEMMELFEPILRADFEVAEENGLTDADTVNVPLFALMGSDEKKVDRISNWGRFTTSRFSYQVLGGGHFFIYQHPEKLAAIVKDCSKRMSLSSY